MSVGVLLTGLVACTAPDVHPAPTPEFQQTALLGPHPTLSPLPLPQARARAAGPPPPSESSAAKLLPPLSGGSFDPDRGADLLSALEGLPEDRKSLGLQGVNGDDLYGDLCEDPGVLLELEEGGARYEASLTVPWGNWLQSWPVPRMIQLSEACAAALNGEGVDSTTCSDEEEAAFFPTGSTCRDCLSGGSDYSSCTADQSCATEAMQQLRAGGTWYGVLSAQALLCAPDFVDEALILVQDMKEGDPLPEPFDHGTIQAICFQGWDGEGVGLWCDQGVAMALGDLLFHRADYIREEGSSDLTWSGRVGMIRSMEVEGQNFEAVFLNEVGGTGISAPVWASQDAWGLDPRKLREGGSDPDDPEQTMAREYFSAFSLKMATTITGIIVNPFIRNRCAEDQWVTGADGSSYCDEPGAWSNRDTFDDAYIAWWDQAAGEAMNFPIVTLASTGLPDPAIPGGLLTELRSGSSLADAEWENCAWQKTFVPDRVRMYDPAPANGQEGYASFDGQTIRFSEDPDLRMGMATNERRGFCPVLP